jgi:hypothetical protein
MKDTVETASGGMIDIRRFMTIGLGNQVILRVLPQQFQPLYCW